MRKIPIALSVFVVVGSVKSGRNVFVEVVHQDGTVGTFGPAVRN